MFSFSLGLVVGALYGWYNTKPAWLDNVTRKVIDKVTGFFKK